MEEVRAVLLEARPSHESPEFKEVAGAFVNIYVTARLEAEALAIASSEIAEAGWLIVAVEDQYSLTRAEAQAAPDLLPYFQQALLDGIVLVFHNYPHGGEDPTALH